MVARQNGFDVSSMKDIGPGSDDAAVLAVSVAEDRVLLTFDKDFGDMVFQKGNQASAGIILFRPRLRDPTHVAKFMLAVLQ
jgi:predicted nuclease of predicted toxin-antitoxin system